jgi:broad specificity phosphatase PhoE
VRRLVLVRHGETLWNTEGRVQGSSDVPLSEEGIAQARSLARFFAESHASFDRIYSSDLSRAVETAKLLSGALGGPDPRTTPLLREIGCGGWEGRQVDEIKREARGEYDRWRAESAFAVPGGESILDVRARAERFFSERAPDLDLAERVLLVGHGILNRMVLSVVMGLDPQNSRYFGQDNTAVNVFEFRHGLATCTAWNARPHLDGAAPLLPPHVPGGIVGGEI